jgi:hypothetical protein
MELTGLGKPNVARALKVLKDHSVISHDNGEYSIQKDYETWIPFEYKQGGKKLSATSTPVEAVLSTTIIDKETGEIISHEYPKLSATITQIISHDNKSLSATSTTKETTKTTITKETNKEKYTYIFEIWNEQKIIIHKKLTADIKRSIDSALRDFTVDEISQAIKNYAEILKGSQYFFDYRWILKDFLKRGLEKFIDKDVARQNFTKEKSSKFTKPEKDPDRFIKGKYGHMVQR